MRAEREPLLGDSLHPSCEDSQELHPEGCARTDTVYTSKGFLSSLQAKGNSDGICRK